jgi:pimeloyl-ACP methyl ester carboxylesterase
MNKIIRKIGIAAGAVVMTGLAAPLLIPIPPLEGMVPPEDLADPDSRFIRIGNVTVHFKKRGNRPPIFLLLHGYLGGTFSWNETMDALAGIGTAIAYDRPAFGLTSRPMPGEWKGPNPYGLEAQARLVIELMDALEIPRATLIAHAMGCGVAALAARSHADRVENLVLVSPEAKPGGRPGWQRLFMATPQMRRLGPVLLRNKVVGQIEELLQKAWHNPSLIPSGKRDSYYKILRLNDWDRALWEMARAMPARNWVCPHEKIQAPTLVVTGDDDRIEGTREIIRLAATIPQTQLAVLPDAGNSPHEETPGAFLQALTEYLAAASECAP